MKPPRSVWVEVGLATGEVYAVRPHKRPSWIRYDLHRPKPKRKARKGERGAR